MKRLISKVIVAALMLQIVLAVINSAEAPASASPNGVNISLSVAGGSISPGVPTVLTVRIENKNSQPVTINKIEMSTITSISIGTQSSILPTILAGETRNVYFDMTPAYSLTGNSVLFSGKVFYTLNSSSAEAAFTLPLSISQPSTSTSPPDIYIPTPEPDPPEPTSPSLIFLHNLSVLHAGSAGSITIEVVNNGDKAAQNLRATLTPGTGLEDVWGANTTGSFNRSLDRVSSTKSGGQNRGILTFMLNIPSSIKTGTYTFSLTGNFSELNSGNFQTFRQDITVFIQNDVSKSDMQIIEVSPLNPVRPGDQFNVTIRVQNTGGADTRDVAVAITNLSGDGISLSGSGSLGTIGQVGAGRTAQSTLALRAAPGIKPGAHPLNIKLTYLDTVGEEQAVTMDVYIEILDVSLEVLRASVPGGALRPGQSAVMTIELYNSSQAEAKNVRVRIAGLSGTGLYLNNEDNNLPSKTVDSIPAGGRASVTYKVTLADAYEGGSLDIQAIISAAGADPVTETVSLTVMTSGSQSMSPKLIIGGYELSRENGTLLTLSAGAVFDLTFTLLNTSAVTPLYNITVNISSADGIFLPAAGSNTFYVDSIPAGGEIERTIKMIVAQSAETKTYPLNFSLDYEDKDGGSYRPTEVLSLPVAVPLVIELSNFNPPVWGEVGMQTNLMFQYINKGKSTVYNFTIDIEGEFSLPDGASTYVGNLSPGYMDYFECMLIPMVGGDVNGAVVLTFEDAAGNKNEIREEFFLQVSEPYYPEPGEFPGDYDPMAPFDPEEGGGWFGLKWWVIIVIGAGVIVAAAVATLLIRRSKKLRRQKALEDGDDADEEDDAGEDNAGEDNEK